MNDPHEVARLKHIKLRQEAGLPPASQQAKTFLSSAVNFVKNGFRVASQKTLEYRKSICFGCEFWDNNAFAGIGRCLKCGCSSAKLRLAHEKCPIGRWAPQD